LIFVVAFSTVSKIKMCPTGRLAETKSSTEFKKLENKRKLFRTILSFDYFQEYSVDTLFGAEKKMCLTEEQRRDWSPG